MRNPAAKTRLVFRARGGKCYAGVNDSAVNALIEPLSAEDRLLFARAYREHYDALRAFVRRRVDTDMEAADLVQEAYLRVLRYRNSAEDRQDLSSLKALLYQIAMNLLVARARLARTRHREDHVPLEDARVVVAPIPSHDRQIAGEQELNRLLALLENGVKSVLVTYPEEGHGVRKFPAIADYSARLLDWFERHMSAGKADERSLSPS